MSLYKLENLYNWQKELNKTVIYDIDDLVIDTKYTDTIKYLDTMSPEERKGYDEGVRNMQKVLKMCDVPLLHRKNGGKS